MAVKALPYLSVDTCKSTTDCTYFGYTGIPATDPMVTELSGFFGASEPNTVVPKFFMNEAAMSAAYDASPGNFVVGVVFTNTSANLAAPSLAGGSPAVQYSYTILANHTAYVSHDYLDSRYATAQAYVERAAINLHRKANNKPPLSSPLPLKTDPGTATTGSGRTFISYANFVGLGSSINSALNAFYVIFCFQAVWLGVMSILVVEKKKRIRSTMAMMGMNRDPYLVSVWAMQNVQNLATCALMVFILFVGRIFINTNALIVWLLLILFSFNATAFGTLAAVFIPDPKKTNSASFSILILTVGSYGICSALVFGAGKVVDPTTETLVFLLPPVALGRAINYITGVEAALGGVTFDNLSNGPCAKALWMMALDCIIYYFLAWYLDAVFPGESGTPLPFNFFLRPSYWGLGEYKSAADLPRHNAAMDSVHHPQSGNNKAQADMFEQVDLSRIPVEEREIIKVRGLRKEFTTGPGWAYSIPLWGIFFRIFYPPNSSRTTGPFSGVQKQEVVTGLDLDVHRNEIFGFLGHNGAGKTTSLSIIMGMLSPSSGSVVVSGHLMPGSHGVGRGDMDLRTLGEVQKQMGVCPQHDVLFDTLTAWETLHLYANIKGVKVHGRKSDAKGGSSKSSSRELLDEYLDTLLDDVYLREKKNERVATYSGGMKRKLSVAIALIGDPRILILDEPTTGMDVFTRKQVWQLIQDSKAGRSTILTTHSMEEADALSDRIAILSHGQLQTMGSSLFLKNRFGLGYRVSLEKRRVMLADMKQPRKYGIQSTSLLNSQENDVVLFDEKRTTAIVQQHFPDATIDLNTVTDIVYVLPTTGTVEERNGLSAQEYIQAKKAALPGLFAHLDEEIAANRLGVKSVGLSLTTLEEVFVSLQEQEETERAAKEDAEFSNLDDNCICNPNLGIRRAQLTDVGGDKCVFVTKTDIYELAKMNDITDIPVDDYNNRESTIYYSGVYNSQSNNAPVTQGLALDYSATHIGLSLWKGIKMIRFQFLNSGQRQDWYQGVQIRFTDDFKQRLSTRDLGKFDEVKFYPETGMISECHDLKINLECFYMTSIIPYFRRKDGQHLINCMKFILSHTSDPASDDVAASGSVTKISDIANCEQGTNFQDVSTVTKSVLDIVVGFLKNLAIADFVNKALGDAGYDTAAIQAGVIVKQITSVLSKKVTKIR
ncbi:ATP-binding cassette sub- A member 2 [Mortierella sp. GBA30]|nr:ATP-binding cassette sub- A member 2 [Mortierella sp. GBA30]